MELRELLFIIHQRNGVGNATLLKIIGSGFAAHELRLLSCEQWQETVESKRLGEIIYDSLQNDCLQKHLTIYRNHGIDFITLLDERYPPLLKQIKDPPVILYGKGDLSLLNMSCIAIVGTRVATVYGKRTTTLFSRELAERGVCVVSGMASGVDGCAHEGALAVGGATIAVLGCSLEYVYPREHKALYEQVATQGLLLSEYPLITPPKAGLFPMRNRIIAGLSRGILVVEAALRSGSLITAYNGVDESRDIFAIPGPITSPKSLGTLDLIKRGAKMVTSVDEILEEYKYDETFAEALRPLGADSVMTASVPLANNSQLTSAHLTTAELRVLEQLSGEPLAFDELLELLQYDFGQLHALLLSLLLKKRILQHPGMCYTLNH